MTTQINCFFAPYVGSEKQPLTAAAAALFKENGIDIAQEVIKRFGLFYAHLLEKALVDSLDPLLATKATFIRVRYKEFLQEGSSPLQKMLSQFSALGGMKVEQVVARHLAPLKYLPMPSEQLHLALWHAPPSLWTPPLRGCFQAFLEELRSDMRKETEWLFSLMEKLEIYVSPLTQAGIQKLLFSRAAYVSRTEEFIPFIDMVAEWYGFTHASGEVSDALLESWCKKVGVAFEFIQARSSALQPEINTQREGVLPGVSLRAYLAARSVSIFAENLNLSLSQAGAHHLSSQFEENEEKRRAFLFFSSSSALQAVPSSDTTATTPFHLCLCFGHKRRRLLSEPEREVFSPLQNTSHVYSSEEKQKLCSAFFEWLIAATHPDLNFSAAAPFSSLEILESLEIINHLYKNSALSLAQAYESWVFLLKNRAQLVKLAELFSFYPQIPILLVLEWVFVAPPTEQNAFLGSLDQGLPLPTLRVLGDVSFPPAKMLAVVTFLLKRFTEFENTRLFIDKLAIEASTRKTLHAHFLEDIYTCQGSAFLKTVQDFRRIGSELTIKFPALTLAQWDPTFAWCVEASLREQEKYFTLCSHLDYKLFTEGLALMHKVENYTDKKLVLFLALLGHYEKAVQCVTTLENLCLLSRSQKENLMSAFVQNLCTNREAHFFNTTLLFLKFKHAINLETSLALEEEKDRVFEHILDASPQEQAQFSSILPTCSHLTLCVSLNLLHSLSLPSTQRLEAFDAILLNHPFFLTHFAPFNSLGSLEARTQAKTSFTLQYLKGVKKL